MLKIEKKVSKNSDLIPQQTVEKAPKYVRVNTLKTSLETVIQEFKNQGYKLLSNEEEASEDTPKWMKQDPHINNLLIFPEEVEFHNHPLLKNGHLVIQDKASCMTAQALYDTLNALGIESEKADIIDGELCDYCEIDL